MRALLTISLALLLAAPAAAAEPIMPLSDVQSGMRCTGLSVVRGTEIASFDVEIVDVVAGDEATGAPRILIRVSGEAVDRTGLGPGFSGSPIVCRDREGRDAYAGAIAESVGEYGNKMALATPMEHVVAQPVEPPVGTPPAPRGARTLAAPLTLAGVSPRGRPSRSSSCARALPWRPGCRAARSTSAPSERCPTWTATACGRSGTRSTGRAAARCSSRTPTSTRSSTTRSASRA